MIFRRRGRPADKATQPRAGAPEGDAAGTRRPAADADADADADTVIDLRDERPGTPLDDLPDEVGGAGGGGGGGSGAAGSTATRVQRAGGDQLTMTTTVDRSAELLLQSFTDDLADSPTGIEFIYRSLERIAARAHADDAMLVIDNAELGRQAFRAGRRPIENTWGRDVVRTAPAGLHLLGSSVEEGLSNSVANLSSLALRLDVATHDSLHDPLTTLLNRRSFDDQLETACSQSERYGWRFALVLIDLDNFKSVNDRLGHQAGDSVLRAVGAELRSGLRAGDAAARVGGDEFALILPNADESLLPSLLERLRRAVVTALPAAKVGLSAGLALAPEDGTDTTSLFRMADQRLYEAKAR